MNRDRFTLYTDAKVISPYVMSAFVALNEKQLPVTLETVDLEQQENLQPAYLDISLCGRVPCLATGDFYLSESSAISEYLEDRFPPPEFAPLYPSDLQGRAKAREMQAWLRSDFMPIRSERPTEVIYFEPVGTPLSTAAIASAQKLFTAVDRLLDEGSTDLFGQWCIADTDLALMINRLLFNGDTVPEKAAAYARAQWQRPAVQLWVQQARER
ncbi:MAG: glutathione transferase [Phormidesmis sp.]